MTNPSLVFFSGSCRYVGVTVGSELRTRHSSECIAVVEKETRPGGHASGRNSGPLHHGIFYAGETLKPQVCATGAKRMRAFAAGHGIAS